MSHVDMTGYSHVAKFNGYYWPAQQRVDGTLVDFRMFGDCGQVLGYYPDKLRRANVPEHLIQAAGESMPPGFVLLADPHGKT